jgi:hypothetical protein
MKDEYDFSDAEQGKFYRPIEELDIPIYLDDEVKAFFARKMCDANRPYSLSNRWKGRLVLPPTRPYNK